MRYFGEPGAGLCTLRHATPPARVRQCTCMHACMHCAFTHAFRRHTGVAGVTALCKAVKPVVNRCSPHGQATCIVADGGAWGGCALDKIQMHVRIYSVYYERGSLTAGLCCHRYRQGAPAAPCSPYDRACTRADTCTPCVQPLVPRVHSPLYHGDPLAPRLCGPRFLRH